MQKKCAVNTLDPKLESILKELNFDISKVLVFAKTDMNLDCDFQDSCFILTEKALIQGTCITKNQLRISSGFTNEKIEDYSDYTFKKIDCKTISEAFTTQLIVGGIFCLKVGDTPTQIAAYTNNCVGRVRKMCDLINKIAKKEKIEEKDLNEDKKEDFCPNCGLIYPQQERKVCPKCLDKRTIFFRLAQYFKNYKWQVVGVFLICIITALTNTIWPYLNGTLLYDNILAKNAGFISNVLPSANNFFLLLGLLVLAMILTKVVQQVFGIIQGVTVSKIVPFVVTDIKNKVFESIQSLSISFFSSRQTGGLMTRILEDANAVLNIFIDGLPFLIPNVLTVIFSCVAMFSINWQLAIVAVITMPFLTFISFKLQPILWHFYSKQYQARRNLNSQLNDNITGARVVKAFGQEVQEITRFKRVNTNLKQAGMNLAKFDIKFTAIYRGAQILTNLLVMVIGSMFILKLFDLKMTYGTLITFTSYIAMLQGPIDFFSYIFRWWSDSMNSAQRIFEILDAKPEVVESKKPIRIDRIKGDVKIENLTFEYEANKEILKDISLEIKSGEMLGIVGKSGSGKSTLVNLISRLYDPKEGNIYIDGINIRDMAFEDVRRNVAMVSQETYIFRGTIFDNIAYAKSGCTKEEVIAAAMSASAHDFICKLPDGYDTFVGSGGRNLSGGERQRISIARAILANPKILILDEATAAVDTETEKNIQAALEKLIVGRTTISIAHRISTLRNAHKLIVIEDGKITEEGTHLELIHKKETYFKLIQIQSKALAMRGVSDQ